MNRKLRTSAIVAAIAYLFFMPRIAMAVIPPDFIFNVGTQVAQFFSVVAITIAAVFATTFRYMKVKYHSIKYKKIVLVLSIASIVTVTLVASLVYAVIMQELEYKKWLRESSLNDLRSQVIESGKSDQYDVDEQEDLDKYDTAHYGKAEDAVDENDKLLLATGTEQTIDVSKDRFVSHVNISDASADFIGKYYGSIANGKFDEAYEMSKKTFSYDIFKNWYMEITKITLDKMVRIDEKKSSIELTLYEGSAFTRYGVLMTLEIKDHLPVRVEHSEVRILEQGLIKNSSEPMSYRPIAQDYDFFDKNQNFPISITNQDFERDVVSGKDNLVILDARENIEFENGYFPGSLHVRFADLKAGRWIEIPEENHVYVLCWSGIRGKEVALFLRTKKIVASYLEDGANGWVKSGGKWIGDIEFGKKYANPRYTRVFNTSEVKSEQRNGVILVDTREPYKYRKEHIGGSYNIQIMYTASIDLEKTFGQIPKDSPVITVCDGYVNCFDAKITGIELERRGHRFLGRYNKPWEYDSEK